MNWTKDAWSQPLNLVWIKRLNNLRARRKQDELRLLDAVWTSAGKSPLTSEKAFDLAYVLLDVQSPRSHPSWSSVDYVRLAAARRLFILTPNVATHEYARLRFLVDARVESRSDIVPAFAPVVRRLLSTDPNDRQVILSGSYLLSHSGKLADIDYAISLADSAIKTQPSDFVANSYRANALLFRWYSTHTTKDKSMAIESFSGLKKLPTSSGRDLGFVDECLRILKGG